MENTEISWAHHTHNVWIGCEHADAEPGADARAGEISEECRHCYAESFDHRMRGEHWGPGVEPRWLSEAYWKKPLKWNADAERTGVRARVFCSSLADWAQRHRDPAINAKMDAVRARLWALAAVTPWLDYLMLTKRAENLAMLLPWMAPDGTQREEAWRNVWPGVTCGTRRSLWRIDLLRRVPAEHRFVSCEPLLDHITAEEWDSALGPWDYGIGDNLIDWLIVGDESGHGRRPIELDAVRTARDAAARHGVRFHVKQWCGASEPGVSGIRKGGPAGKIHLPVLDGRVWSETP